MLDLFANVVQMVINPLNINQKSHQLDILMFLLVFFIKKSGDLNQVA